MYKYSWIALQLMMADASWYDYDQDTKAEEESKDNDDVIWVTSSSIHNKVKNRFSNAKK